MIQYDDKDVPNKYGVTLRQQDIFEMAKKNIAPDDSFTEEELEYYKKMLITFEWCDSIGRSRDTVVQWYNE